MKIDAPKYVLAFDTETSGLASKSPDPSIDHKTGEFYQTVAWGVVVLDFATYEAVDTYKAFVQPVKGAQWNKRAEAVHGLSQEWLAANGKPEEDVMVDLFELILKYWGTTTPIIALGHNVMFDISFTNSLFMGLTGLTGSDAMFETFGLPARGAHDPLEDILMTVICAKEMRNAYERGIACAACGT
jgi:DNA polymerase III epsilon subunit-like protein